MSKCAECNELVGEEWSANNGLCITCARDEVSSADTNQADGDELGVEIAHYLESTYQDGAVMATRPNSGYHKRVDEFTDKLLAIIRTEKLKLLAELDKSMPTAEQLATRYGYHMPEKQYGYRLALYDVRDVIEAERKKL